MTDDIVERLRAVVKRAWDWDYCYPGNINIESLIIDLRKDAGEAADEIERLREQNAKLRSFSLKALTVVEWAAGEGAVMEHPVYDADDLLLEGCDLLGVECAADARAALEEK